MNDNDREFFEDRNCDLEQGDFIHLKEIWAEKGLKGRCRKCCKFVKGHKTGELCPDCEQGEAVKQGFSI